MTSRLPTTLVLLLAAILPPRPLLAADASGDMQVCRRAAVAAEQEQGLPSGLLLAIGQQESGRWNAASGAVEPWPYAANAAGEGRLLSSRAEAIFYVTDRLRSGIQSIDVGCFQINLHHHPTAFSSLEEAFDPEANARYAARFLKALYTETGSWEAAIGRYHSATPGLGDSYRAAVLGRWGGRGTATPAAATRSTPGVEIIAGVTVQRPLAPGGQVNVLASSAGLPHVITPGGGLSHHM
nr:lytic transglycosylase domain-containing protein [uncultured Rhodopila sp.]